MDTLRSWVLEEYDVIQSLLATNFMGLTLGLSV